jgi:hypothetical protein
MTSEVHPSRICCCRSRAAIYRRFAVYEATKEKLYGVRLSMLRPRAGHRCVPECLHQDLGKGGIVMIPLRATLCPDGYPSAGSVLMRSGEGRADRCA